MKAGEKKIGRPSSTEKREELVLVNFKADAETLEVIDELAAALGGGNVRGKRSLAIRRALFEARDRLAGSTRKR